MLIEMHEPTGLARARAWVDAEAPILWLLGKTQAGKTSIVAELTGQGHDEVGRGYLPMTKESRLYAFPAQQPVLRFLDTRGLADCAGYDATNELAQAQEQAHLLLIVVRADDLDLAEIIEVAAQARRQRKTLPLLVAQTGLHRRYGKHDRHAEPYPFDGTDADARRAGVPHELSQALVAQRQLFARIKGEPPVFVPLDFTRPEQGVAPTDYGADRLWDLLEQILPGVSARLRADPAATGAIRARIILPWSLAAAAANAVPVPVAGGMVSASMQAAMVANIAHRLGCAGDWKRLWAELVGALGSGFLLAFGGSWSAQQVLKLGLGWGSAIVASWTFAITWAIGEVGLYYFSAKLAGEEPDQAALRERYRQALREARGRHKTLKQQARQADDH
ncbi:GTPase [Thiohalocapsa marina]|nr:GTPase [Thiohalocapsa marina]